MAKLLEAVYIVVKVTPESEEGLALIQYRGTEVALVTDSEDKMGDLWPLVINMARQNKMRFKLLKFTGREEIAVATPETPVTEIKHI